MGDVFVYLSLFVILFACILLAVTTLKKIFSVITIFEYEKGLKYHKGKFQGLLEPGLYWIMPIRTSIIKIDIRPSLTTVAGQEIVTKEGISFKINAVARHEIIEPVLAINSDSDFEQGIYTLIQLALRETICMYSLSEILDQRSMINEKLMEILSPKIQKLGLKLHEINIKDITLPGDLKKAFAQIVREQKEGLARLERARSEMASLRNLANAAKILESNPKLLQLRVLQSLGETSGNTIVLNLSDDKSVVPIINKEEEGNPDKSH